MLSSNIIPFSTTKMDMKQEIKGRDEPTLKTEIEAGVGKLDLEALGILPHLPNPVPHSSSFQTPDWSQMVFLKLQPKKSKEFQG
jgi:hypothetical protein